MPIASRPVPSTEDHLDAAVCANLGIAPPARAGERVEMEASLNAEDRPDGRVLVETGAGGVATIRLNRPEKLNALSGAMREDLARAISAIGRAGESTGLIITGAGRAFSAGEDLAEAVEFHRASEVEESIERFHQLSRALLGTQVPVIAAINGIAVGGASELTFACDARIGSDRAEFFMPENGRGLTISNATSYLLPRLVGANALAFVLDSRRIGAEEALRIGLLQSVVAAEELEATATARLLSWTAPGSTYAHHLALLRPRMEDVEAAMRRETAVALAAWEEGLTTSGIQRFLSAGRGKGNR